MAFQKLPFPHVREVGFLACGGFGQGRAPSLRAPEGSLDGFRRKQHNARKREWERSSEDISTLPKGDISTLLRHDGQTAMATREDRFRGVLSTFDRDDVPICP